MDNIFYSSILSTCVTVGGIYTVLRTKAGCTVDELGEDYCMVGIVNEKFVAMEVEKMEFKEPALREAVNELRRNYGVR